MVRCQQTFEQRSGRGGARPVDSWGRETEMGTGNIILWLPCQGTAGRLEWWEINKRWERSEKRGSLV